MSTGLWTFRMDGFQGWNGEHWGYPNISSAQDWDNPVADRPGSLAGVRIAPRLTEVHMGMTPLLAALVASSLSVSAAPVPCPAAGPPYYSIELVTTRNISGTGLADGVAEVSVPASSPFAIEVAEDGSYVYDVAVSIDRMRAPRSGRLVAWVTTPEVDRVERIGVLDERLSAAGRVRWNKFLVVVTLEAEDDPTAERWSGPIVFRGIVAEWAHAHDGRPRGARAGELRGLRLLKPKATRPTTCPGPPPSA